MIVKADVDVAGVERPSGQFRGLLVLEGAAGVTTRTSPARLLYSAGLRSERPGQTYVSMPLGHLTTGGQGVVGSNPAVPTV